MVFLGKSSKYWQLNNYIWLREEYIDKQRTALEIANEIGVDGSTVRYHLIKFGIPLRLPTETNHLPQVLQKNRDANSGENNAMYGKTQSDHTIHLMSIAATGRKMSDEQKRKQSIRMSGDLNPMKRPEVRAKITGDLNPSKRPDVKVKLAGQNCHMWKGGISYEPYCPKWTKEFRQRIRAFFNNECIICGKPQSENLTKTGRCWKLSCHHVEYNKQACCDGLPAHFAALCLSCHSKTNYDILRWQDIIHRIIDEIYDGKSYYTKEEYKSILF